MEQDQFNKINDRGHGAWVSDHTTSLPQHMMEQQYYLDQDGVAYAIVESQQVLWDSGYRQYYY